MCICVYMHADIDYEVSFGPFATTLVNLRVIVLSEISQTLNVYSILHTCGSKMMSISKDKH